MRFAQIVEGLADLVDAATMEMVHDPVHFPHHPADPVRIYDSETARTLFESVRKDRADLMVLRGAPNRGGNFADIVRAELRQDANAVRGVNLAPERRFWQIVEEQANQVLGQNTLKQVVEARDGGFLADILRGAAVPENDIPPILEHRIEDVLVAAYGLALKTVHEKVKDLQLDQAVCPYTRAVISEADMRPATLFKNVFVVAAMDFLNSTHDHDDADETEEVKTAYQALSREDIKLARQTWLAIITRGGADGLIERQVQKLAEWGIPDRANLGAERERLEVELRRMDQEAQEDINEEARMMALAIQLSLAKPGQNPDEILARYPNHCMKIVEQNPGEYRLLILTRSPHGVLLFHFDALDGTCKELSRGPVWVDRNGWDAPGYSSTLRVETIRTVEGRELLLLLARASNGLRLHCYDPRENQWRELSANPIFTDQNGFNQPCYYSTLRTEILRDPAGHERLLVIARAATGIRMSSFDLARNAWSQLAPGPAWSDKEGWSQESQYSTLRTQVIRRANGEEELVVLGRGKDDINLASFSLVRNVWMELPRGPSWSDANGFNQKPYYATIRAEAVRDAEGHEQLMLIGRAGSGIRLYAFNFVRNTWLNLESGPEWSDKNGWNEERYYSTIRTEVIQGGQGAPRDQLLISAVSGSGVRSSVYDPMGNRWLGIGTDPSFRVHKGDSLQDVVLKRIELEHRVKGPNPMLLYQASLLQRERKHAEANRPLHQVAREIVAAAQFQ